MSAVSLFSSDAFAPTPEAPSNESVAAAPVRPWEHLSPEIQQMVVADLKGRDLSRFARSAHTSSQSSAASLLRRDPPERNAQLAQLVEYGAAPTIAALLQLPNNLQFDWEQRDVKGATLLMRALENGSNAVVETLIAGPASLFAGMDASGWNTLHHAVSRGQTRFLRAMLDRHPLLAAYADLSGNQAGTPLRLAYTLRDEAMFDLLLATPVAEIDALITRAIDPAQPLPRNDVYPFDLAGRPVDLAARKAMSNTVAHRQPAASRLELLKAMINDDEPVFVHSLLNKLEPDALARAREEILQLVTERGQFAAARMVIHHFEQSAFAPLWNGATLCHLAARRMDDELLNWVLRKPAARALLDVRDDDGRTPLQCAAAAGSVRCFVALHRHSLDLTLRDAYQHGVLQLLFRADPAAAHRILENPTVLPTLTAADLTATLQTALRKLLEFDFEQSWQPNDENTLEVNTDLIDTLLSLPAGRIDIHAPVGGGDHSILTLLESGALANVLDRGGDEERYDAGESVRRSYSHYENAALLARARLHCNAPGHPAAPPPGPADDLL
ncbi:MAG: ankyrin repeat domain-containing protein [Janthinobacterium lividum]